MGDQAIKTVILEQDVPSSNPATADQLATGQLIASCTERLSSPLPRALRSALYNAEKEGN